MKHLFSPENIAEIEQAITKAEIGSHGEIVPIIAKTSDNYLSTRYIFAIVFTVILMSCLLIEIIDSKFYLALALILSVISGINLARFIPHFCLPFINKSEMHDQVNRRAAECFYDYNLGNTKKGSALLIYISAFEHLVMIKTDMRSGKIISDFELQEICNLVVTGMKEKKPTPALIAAIEKCGNLLRNHFPCEEETAEELPNKIHFIGFKD